MASSSRARASSNSCQVTEEPVLRWPDGWPRNRVGSWKSSPAPWRKKSLSEHRKLLESELSHMGAASAVITRSSNERDPGVAVWFSMTKDQRDWQDALEIENPLPTLDEIARAFHAKAREVHPDRADGKGDVAVYHKLVDARAAARDWVLGVHTTNHEFVMALDQFDTVGANIAGLRLAFANLRSLKRLGMPTILERTLNKAFKAAIAASTSTFPGTGGQG